MAVGDALSQQISEQVVLEVWREMFHGGIMPHDNFFDVGGDSLSAALLIARLNTDLSVGLTAADLFRNPTVADLVKFLESAK